MLDCEPSENEEYPSEIESGGVSAPELIDVQVLERERPTQGGRVKTGIRKDFDRSSPSAINTVFSKLCLSKRPCFALIMRSSPNFSEYAVEAIDGLDSRTRLFGDS
jgi:hypothetical protein